jgi:hypothetical protein
MAGTDFFNRRSRLLINLLQILLFSLVRGLVWSGRRRQESSGDGLREKMGARFSVRWQSFPGRAGTVAPVRRIGGIRSEGSRGGMVSCGDFVDELAFGFCQPPPVALLILFLELLQNLSFLYSFDQGLALLTHLAFSSRHAFLLSVDVTLQPLQIRLEQQHVRPAKTLALFAALFLETLPAAVLLFFQDGLFIGQRTPRHG